LEWHYGRFRIQLYADYSGELSYEELAFEERGKPELYASDENGNPYSPSWYAVSIKSQMKFKDFSIMLGLENITNQLYRPYSSGIAAPGRNLVVSFTASF
jgi:hemoglobin/transferrin/lactoferrin receptor protein